MRKKIAFAVGIAIVIIGTLATSLNACGIWVILALVVMNVILLPLGPGPYGGGYDGNF